MLRRSRKFRGHRGEGGFTLIELMVTLSVVAILAVMAAPSLSSFIRSNRLSSAANEMVATLQTARTNAISNRARVAVCPSADGTTCAAEMSNRWIAVMTKNGASTVLRDSAFPGTVTLTASANLSGGTNTFTFFPSGFSVVGANAGGATSGTIGLCVSEMSGNNSIDVSASVGRISTARRAATADCSGPEDN
ncbi:MAG: GspH/FimT family pseudopilin [Pseudoxanthomonas sp.]